MLTFYVRHGLIVVETHEIISFKQSMWLEKYVSFKTQKRKKAKSKLEKDFFKLINNGFFGKVLENVRHRTKIEITKTCEKDDFIEQQSKLTFIGVHKSYTNYSSYTFKENEVVMD